MNKCSSIKNKIFFLPRQQKLLGWKYIVLREKNVISHILLILV